MSTLNDYLTQYAIEAGEIRPEDEPMDIGVGEVMADETQYAGQNSASDMVAHAEKADYIADQLDELAQRADQLADEDHAHLRNEVSVEALHREFNAVMRANDFQFKASSFECEFSDVGRLKGISRDSRRVASTVRGFRDDLMDLSQEGAILQWLRGDKSRLKQARDSLDRSAGSFKKIKESLKEKPVVINNNGLALFLTKDMAAVDDLKKAIDGDVNYLNQAFKVVNGGCEALMKAADEIKKGGADKYKSGQLVAGINAVETKTGGLLGSHTIKSSGKDDFGEFKGLAFPDFSRSSEHKITGKAIAKSIGWTLANYIGWSIVIGTGLSLVVMGGAVTGGIAGAAAAAKASVAVAPVLQAARNIASIRSGLKAASEEMNSSNKKSVSSIDELFSAIEGIKGLEQQLNFKMADVDFKAKLEGIEDKAAVKALEKAWGRIASLADEIYEQAIYITTMTATLLETTVNKAK